MDLYLYNFKIITTSWCSIGSSGRITQRAFLMELDLSQAEAVADLISSSSAASHKLALSQMKGGYSRELQELRYALLQFLSCLNLN